MPATLETLEKRLIAVEQELTLLKQSFNIVGNGENDRGEHEQRSAIELRKKPGFRDRALAFMEDGPHLSPETAEQLRKDIREAREEHFG